MKVAVRSFSGGLVPATPTLVRFVVNGLAMVRGDNAPSGGTSSSTNSDLVFIGGEAPDPVRQKLHFSRSVRQAARRAYRSQSGLPPLVDPNRVEKRKAARHAASIAEDPATKRVWSTDIENAELRRANPLTIVNETARGTCTFPMSLTGSDTGDHAFCGEGLFPSPSRLSFCAFHLMTALLPSSPSHRLARAQLVCDLGE